LAVKAEHGACPEMVTDEIVRETGPVDTILTHVDLDGLYAAAKWILGGREPYPGADDDARAVDTRQGEPSPTGRLIDEALRAHFRDEALKHRVVRYLVGGLRDREHRAVIEQAARDFAAMQEESRRLAEGMQRRGHVVIIDAGRAKGRYDKTALLLFGQEQAPVAIVRDSGMVTLAAEFSSGINFVELLGLGGGMPTRVSIPESRLDEAVERINQALGPVAPPPTRQGQSTPARAGTAELAKKPGKSTRKRRS
jgi:hypothetical protein